MKLFICIDHDVRWPVGGASVVVASTKEEAKTLLDDQLFRAGLSTVGYTLQEVNLQKKQAIILCDGNY